MKRLKGLDEVHEIIEKIYEEEKDLTSEKRIKRISEESERFLSERGLSLRRVRPKEIKHSAA